VGYCEKLMEFDEKFMEFDQKKFQKKLLNLIQKKIIIMIEI